jgi:pimeloyl-ACP methyl ester carboxylesterase
MRYGQLHYRMADPGKAVAAGKRPLVYFTQSPYSSLEFGAMLTEMGRDRLVIAIDTPGYGSSDGPRQQPKIEDYESAVSEALRNLGFGRQRPIDLIGLHTGAFTAIEMAIREPQMIRRVALVGVWLVDEDQRLKAIANLPRYRTTDEFFAWFNTARPVLKKRQLGSNLTDEQWGQVMADSLRPLTRREYGHDAAFEYAQRLRVRIPLVTQPVLLIALNDGLRDFTLASKPLFRNAQLADFPQLQEGAFFNNAPELGRALRDFLDRR